jgi:hypothetical protein
MILPVVIFGGLGIWAIVALFRWLGRRRKAKPGKLAPTAKSPQTVGP